MPWRAFLTPEAFEDGASWGVNQPMSRNQSNYQGPNVSSMTTFSPDVPEMSFVPQQSMKSDQMDTEMYSMPRQSAPGLLNSTDCYVVPASPLSAQSSPSVSRSFDNCSEQAQINSPGAETNKTSIETGMCPILTGQVKQCNPEQCGPNAPCTQNLNLSEIEDCVDVQCLSPVPVEESTSFLEGADQRVASTLNRGSSSPSLVGRKDRRTRTQRQSTATSTDDPDQRKAPKGRMAARQAHSIVERRYRENLNGKIVQLHRTLLAAQHGTLLSENVDNEDVPSLSELKAVRKSDVLTDAMEYVHQSEVEMRHMETELQQMRAKVVALEKLVRCEDCSVLKQLVNMQVQQQQLHRQTGFPQ